MGSAGILFQQQAGGMTGLSVLLVTDSKPIPAALKREKCRYRARQNQRRAMHLSRDRKDDSTCGVKDDREYNPEADGENNPASIHFYACVLWNDW